MKFKTKITLVLGSMLAAASANATVADAATSFSTQWAADAALIGGALIGAAFVAIGFKWVKGMIFG